MAHTMPRDKGAAEIQDSIRQILYHDWNPIGFAGLLPEDEYDSYIGPVYRILAGTRSEAELIALLRWTESETIGVSPASDEQLRSVARKRLALNVKL
jgi:hypothetical protein